MQLGMEQGWSPTRPTSMESCAAEYRGISASSVNGLYGSGSNLKNSSVRSSCSALSGSDTPSGYHYPYYSPTDSAQSMEELSPHVAGGVASPWSSTAAAEHHRSSHAAAAAAARQYNHFGNVSPSFLTAATANSSHASHHHQHQQYLPNSYSSAYNFHNSAYPLHDMTGKFDF